jgi:putative transport protein
MFVFIELLVGQPLILLFLISAIGYTLGKISVAGNSLGVAAVLFVGLAFGALDQRLKLPETLYQFGLVLFVYTIGLGSGTAFFRAIRKRGVRDNAFVLALVLLAGVATYALARWLGIGPARAAGLFTGALTNTPALAAVLEQLQSIGAAEALRNEPVVGYSIAYPMGVIGMIASLAIGKRLFKPNFVKEAADLRALGATSESLINRTVVVTQARVIGKTVQQVMTDEALGAMLTRVENVDRIDIVAPRTVLAAGDRVLVVGNEDDVDRATRLLGATSDEALEADRRTVDFRRVFVSNPDVIGRRIGDLDMPGRFGALITRVRRGDLEFLARDDLVLEPGDRVRFVALRERMDEVSRFFGDSYRAVSEIDILSFGLGILLGLLLGQIPIPLPGGGAFKLGIAGGPLIVALVLSAVHRSGPVVWSIPYAANLALRQIGLIAFLAGVGTRAGFAFVETLSGPGGFALFAAGASITLTGGLIGIIVGYRLLRVPFSLLSGMMAALQTNPAILGFAEKQANNELPAIGYSTVYPVAMVAKIVLAQVLFSALSL